MEKLANAKIIPVSDDLEFKVGEEDNLIVSNVSTGAELDVEIKVYDRSDVERLREMVKVIRNNSSRYDSSVYMQRLFERLRADL